MTATQPTATKTANKSSKAAPRPVAHVLLELAYLMHATKVVGVRGTGVSRQAAGRSI